MSRSGRRSNLIVNWGRLRIVTKRLVRLRKVLICGFLGNRNTTSRLVLVGKQVWACFCLHVNARAICAEHGSKG